MSELHDLTALDQVRRLREGNIKPIELVEHYLTRIQRIDPQIGAFVTVTPDAARERAERLGADGGDEIATPLWGLPSGDKDLNARAGVRTTYGSRLTAQYVPTESDPIVQVMDAAGAISVGKTNTPEFGLPSYTENLVAPPTRSPWDLKRGAGGSSGGAAAAVAAGLLPAAWGTDGGGSIRIPAACCGIVGLKPSRGRVPALGGFGALAGLPTAGSLARTVADAALLLDAMSALAPDPLRDAAPVAVSDQGAAWATVPPGQRGVTLLQAAERGEGSYRVGVTTDSPWRSHYEISVAAEASDALDVAMATLAALGHEVGWLDVAEDPGYAPAFRTVWQAGAAQIPAEGDAVQLLEPLTQWLVSVGRQVSARQLGEALAYLAGFERTLIATFAQYDAVMTPTLAVLPPEVGSFDQVDGEHNFAQQVQMTPWTSMVNASGLPAIQLPVHWSAAGIPMGVQLIGRPGGERTLLAIAAGMQDRLRWQERHPACW